MNAKQSALTAAIGSTLLAFPLSQGAHAQEETGELEEVIVTARKREESLQNVGLAVSAMSRTEIERTFARDLMDLSSVSPNLIIDDAAQGPGGVAAIFIRGIGVADVEKNFDPAVGVVVDGIFLGANSGSLLRSMDLASVEVLRGPQGTLFGRNTIGGLINVTHTQPTGEFGLKLRAGVETYDTHYLDGILNFGLGENLAAKLFYSARDQQDGYYDRVDFVDGGIVTVEEDVGANDYQSYGINLLWDVTETLAFEYTYREEETDQDTPPLLNTAQPRHEFCKVYCSPDLNTPITGDRYKIAQNYVRPGGERPSRETPVQVSPRADAVPAEGASTFDTEFHQLEARWDISAAWRLDYLYGIWESDETILSNWDGTPIFLYGTDRPATYEQESHELRVTYDEGGKFSLVAGAYYWESEYYQFMRSYVPAEGFDQILDILLNTTQETFMLDILQETEQETESRAVFFEADYNVTDALTLTLGGRYTEDEKLSRQYGLIVTGPNHPSDEWSEFTPRLGARYRLTEDMMVFATYSAGYRSGGFNGRVGNFVDATQPYDPEKVDNYEIGIKSEWLGQRLRVNANYFYMDYQDKQEELQLPDDNDTGQKTVVENASTATIQGIELDIQAFLTDQLSLRANLGWLDSGYDDFSYVGLEGPVDLSNLEFRRAPDLTGTLDVTYEWDMVGGQAWVRLAYHYIGEHFVNVSNVPELENDAQHLIDASVNFAINGLQFSLFGRNLADEDGYTQGYDVAGLWSYASARAPRTYGLEVQYDFRD